MKFKKCMYLKILLLSLILVFNIFSFHSSNFIFFCICMLLYFIYLFYYFYFILEKTWDTFLVSLLYFSKKRRNKNPLKSNVCSCVFTQRVRCVRRAIENMKEIILFWCLLFTFYLFCYSSSSFWFLFCYKVIQHSQAGIILSKIRISLKSIDCWWSNFINVIFRSLNIFLVWMYVISYQLCIFLWYQKELRSLIIIYISWLKEFLGEWELCMLNI